MSDLRVALLRAVNVGGRKLAMADLRSIAQDAGLEDVRTIVASGNLVFRGGEAAPRVEAALEERLERHAGLRTDVIVRTARECAEALAAGPFAAEAKAEPSRTMVMYLKAETAPGRAEALAAAVGALPEKVAVHGREVYLYYPDGAGRSKLTGALIERRLGVRGTVRNWNTASKLAALAG